MLKKIINSSFLDVTKIRHYIFFAVIPGLTFYVISLIVLNHFGFSSTEILRDSAQQTGQSSWLGFVSNIGVWLWVSAVTVCFFGFILNGKTLKRSHNQLLVLLGMFSLVLVADDFFLIHDRYINQKYCYLFYAVYAICLLTVYLKEILSASGSFFFLAGALLASSIATDLLQDILPFSYEASQLLEEGFKFMGGVTWLYFCGNVAIFRQN